MMIDTLCAIHKMRPDREPDFNIGDPVYMQRWYLIPRNPSFNIYYHRVLRDDDDRALHDHPWPSFSIMVSGALREVLPDGERIVKAGDCVYRGPEFAHRLALIDGEPAETLFITGPRVRDWGFHCPKGFVAWQDFLEPDDTGLIGRGCGEMA